MSRKKKFKRVLLCALLISLPFLNMVSETGDNDNKVVMCYNENIGSYSISNNDTVLGKLCFTIDEVDPVQKLKDSIKNELIDELEKYIFKYYPKTHKNIPTLLVETGLEHNIDILFMMAQTQQETGFGTLGAGRETSRHSLFGVAVRKYNTYDHAIADYVKILKKSYLTKGRTEQHLMQKYVTTGGSRYAGDPHYEATLRKTYKNILAKTNIKMLQEKYMNS